MRKHRAAVALVVACIAVAGCAPKPLTDALTSLEVCARSVTIFVEMQDVLSVAFANPLEASTYADQFGELTESFTSLAPTDDDLATAHSELGARMELILATMRNPSIEGARDFPDVLSGAESALRAYGAECSLGFLPFS